MLRDRARKTEEKHLGRSRGRCERASGALAPCFPPEPKGNIAHLQQLAKEQEKQMVRQKQNGALPELGTRWPGPVWEEGPAEPGRLRSPLLCSGRWSRAAAHSGPQAQPCQTTYPRVLWPCSSPALTLGSFLNAVPKAGDGVISAPTSSFSTRAFSPQNLNCTPACARLLSAFMARGSRTRVRQHSHQGSIWSLTGGTAWAS